MKQQDAASSRKSQGPLEDLEHWDEFLQARYPEQPAGAIEPARPELRLVLAVAGLFNILYVVYPAPLVSAAGAAAKSLF